MLCLVANGLSAVGYREQPGASVAGPLPSDRPTADSRQPTADSYANRLVPAAPRMATIGVAVFASEVSVTVQPPAIRVDQLQKTFTVPERDAGLKAALASLV